MEDFPDALRGVVVGAPLSSLERGLIEKKELRAFWHRVAAHVPAVVERRQANTACDAACILLGAVLTPLRLGHDAHGTAARRLRSQLSFSVARRRRAAQLALELAELLAEIERDPLPPDEVISVGAALGWPAHVADAVPTYYWCTRSATVVQNIAAALEAEPPIADAPGLTSQKPSWRGYLREVRANLAEVGFTLREIDAVRLAYALCEGQGAPPPSRDAVHDLLRCHSVG
jgi:hypothetical protein